MEFIMKLHPNLRNAKGELVPLSTIKNDLKMALASVRQKLTAYHRNKEKQQDLKMEEQREGKPLSTTIEMKSSLELLSGSKINSQETSSPNLHFKIGFLVQMLKEVAYRDEDFYMPIALGKDEQRMLSDAFNAQLFDIVLSSVGMAVITQQSAEHEINVADKHEESKEKQSKANGCSPKKLKKSQGADDMMLGFKRRLPLWVYNHLADTLAVHLPS